MKRAIAIAFLIVYVGYSTEMHEFLRMPVLVYHYFEHQHQSEVSLSLYSFIEHHYFSHDVADGDHDDHKELPFQNHDGMLCNAMVVATLPVQFIFVTCKPICRADAPHHSEVNFPLNYFSSDIWQPPRLS